MRGCKLSFPAWILMPVCLVSSIVLAADGDLQASSSAVSDTRQALAAPELTEILVTAQKTGAAERLQDVPLPISVISAQQLLQSNQAQIQDYFNQIPGLNVSEASNGLQVVSIRGITTGQNTNPTVGFTLDDVPLGASTNTGTALPFINPADLAQVEVLRGPQGTLYGDNSMGGLIRYVTVDPSTDRFFGDVRVGGDGVVNGTRLGYNASAAVNVPLTDTLAIRVSGYERLDPGYVDDVATGARGVNTTKSGGGRISAKWTPSADFSVKFSGLYERTDTYGSEDIDVPTIGFPNTADIGDLQQYNPVRGSGIYDQEFRNLSLTLSGNLLGIKLTSITGYTLTENFTTYDFSWAFGTPPTSTSPGIGVPFAQGNQLHKVSQEVRLSDSIGSHLEWLLGGFYTKEDDNYYEDLTSINLANSALISVPADVYYSGSPGRFTEEAGFGALTVKVTDQFDVQFGGRESYLETPILGSCSGGSYVNLPPGPAVCSPPSSSFWKANVFTYSVSPRYKLTPDLMVYARVADGFRPGSGTSNPLPTAGCVLDKVPCIQYPDKTTDYEIGSKAELFDHTLTVDSSIYYIKWSDLQVTLLYGRISSGGNGAGAKSEGVDLSLTWRPLQGLTVSTWEAWNNAATTQPFVNSAAGQPLPYAARFSGNFSLNEEFPIIDQFRGFVRATEIYVGERLAEFTVAGSPRQELPAYSQTNADAGIKTGPWTFSAYVNNATDRRGLTMGGLGSQNAPFEFDIIRPRVIGLSAERTF